MRIAGSTLLLSAWEREAGAIGSWQTAQRTEYGPNGDLRLTLTDAVVRRERTGQERSDLELDLEWRDGNWEPEAWGFAPGYNTADHYSTVSALEREDRLTVEVRLTLGSDLRTPGSAAHYTLNLKRTGVGFEGSYAGVFDNIPVSGKAAGTFHEPWPRLPLSGFTPVATGEHPRLIFRPSDRERLQQRAATDWGKVVLDRLREMLERGEFVYVGDTGANSAYFAAGHAFQYWLTNDLSSLSAAREITAASIKTVPTRKGLLSGYAPHLMGLSLAYDFCYDAWDEPFRREVVRYLETMSARVLAGRGSGSDYRSGSNELARMHGAAGIALAAIHGDAGATEQLRGKRLRKLAERSVERYLAQGLGDHGFGQEEGDDAGAMEMVFGMMQAYRTAFGREMASGSGAEWVLPLYILRSFRGELGNPVVHRYGPNGGPTRAVSGTLFALGLGSTKEAHRPAARHFYDTYWGTPSGDNTFGITSPQTAPYLLALYPENTPAQTPTKVLPRAVQDERKGFFVFRNEEFVTTVYAKSDTASEGTFPDAGTFRIHGFGTDWAIRANGRTRESENVAFVRLGVLPGDGKGRVTYYEGKPDGSGSVSMDLDAVYREGKEKKDVGILSFRAFGVDYSGDCGAPALFVILDRVSGGTERQWLLHTAGKSVRLEGNAFVIEGEDGATLRGTFITPSPVRLFVEEKTGIHTLRAMNDDRKSSEFFVIMTIQKGDAPPVSVQGQGLSATVTVGKQTIQYAIPGKNAPPP